MALLKNIQQAELAYTKEFADASESESAIIFTDTQLPDMDHHNFTYIKEGLSNKDLKNFIENDIKRRYSEGYTAAFFISDFKLDPTFFKASPYEVSYYSFDYMSLATSLSEPLKCRDDVDFMEASNPTILEDGIKVDIEANTPFMGDFAPKRIQRKAKIYRDKNARTTLYVGYHKNKAIGNCELFISGDIAKMEDFDILEKYQRQGFGTAFVKYILEVAKAQGAKTLYIVTDSDDTAKDMYSKCHFKKVGTKHEVYIDFSKKGR